VSSRHPDPEHFAVTSVSVTLSAVLDVSFTFSDIYQTKSLLAVVFNLLSGGSAFLKRCFRYGCFVIFEFPCPMIPEIQPMTEGAAALQ